MECFGKGIITEKDTTGLKLNFGNENAMIKFVEKIARRWEWATYLAEVVKKFSEKLDVKTRSFALRMKGLELPSYNVRASPGMDLAYLTHDRKDAT